MFRRALISFRAPVTRSLAQPAVLGGAMRAASRSYATYPAVKPKKSHPFRWGMIIGLAIGVGWAYVDRHGLELEQDDKIQPPTKCDPFPRKIDVRGEKYSVIGVGYRAVTFMSFHVYALGIYIAEKDVSKARKILDSIADLSGALADPESSPDVIGHLLDNGVRFAVRIVPVRNTDFLHIRDGLVRSVTGNPAFKALGNSEDVGQGLNELKQAFSRKRSIPKGDVITIAQVDDGKLYCEYALKASQSEPEELGLVAHPGVGRLLFLQYLSGKNPNSPTASKSSHDGLVSL
ncbi:Altered inheritance of mitochondria protein 18, mitochondrial [Wickerhamiella sorbophila]|uniref:Altered inheritance of mitochondria protein 18, mitochondrial n=1 Tax=Wickerhamiella sorbophila TaxID=45607 RepID=A0A2T0FJS0_9ASCO|nr:Altered inheritance of mitochondria protein 18, mitochondrial [Wickerhamiella sorbophila]PRT55244.1 Altered inheritance of mitochondria protein 18, mitochondrial [Wickerhamiella sorbophila]